MSIHEIAALKCEAPPGVGSASSLGYSVVSGTARRIWYDEALPHVVHLLLPNGNLVFVPVAKCCGMLEVKAANDNAGVLPAEEAGEAYFDALRSRVEAAKKAKRKPANDNDGA